MKQVCLRFPALLLLGITSIFLSCSKDPDSTDPIGGGGTGGGGGAATSTITFFNPTPTPLTITFNGTTKIAPVGGDAVFSGTALTAGTGQAVGKGDVINGYSVGLTLTWPLSLGFPAAGTDFRFTLNVGPDYFFLKLKNNSVMWNIVSVSVNSQSSQAIDIPPNGTVYNVGYFKAFTNSTVRATPNNSSGSYWNWSNLALPLTNNQIFLGVAN